MLNCLPAAFTSFIKAVALSIFGVVLFFRPVSAQETDAMPVDRTLKLSEAIQVALANNPQVKRSLLNVKTADEQVQLAWSEVLPEISGNASYVRNIELPVSIIPANRLNPNAPEDSLIAFSLGQENNWQAGISIQQTLFRGEAIVGISSSKLFKAVQSENLRATSQQVVTQTRLAYYDVLIAEEELQLQQATVERLEENLAENQSLLEAGLIDQYAVLQVQVQLSNQKPQLTAAKYAVEQAYRELKMVLGVPLGLDFSVLGNLDEYNIIAEEATEAVNKNLKRVNTITPYQYIKPENITEIAKNHRGDIRVLETQNELKVREIKAIKSRFLPTLSATYNLNLTAAQPGTPVFFGTDLTRTHSQALGFTLSVPIFDGFERTANISMAKIEKKDLEIQKRTAIRSAKNEIESAREALNQAIETAPARREALELAQTGYERARLRMENGLGSQLDVINAELQLREAEANYAQMVYNYLAAKARYDLAIGMVPFVDEDTILND